MSETRQALIALNMQANCVTPLKDITDFVIAVTKLKDLKLFRETKPRVNSIYRHLDSLPESILDPRDVKSFKELIIKSCFTGVFYEKQVLSASDFAALDSEGRAAVTRNKQSVITNSDVGRDFWIEMLKVERAYDIMTRRLHSVPIFETYRLFRVLSALGETRHSFYTSDSVRAETYTRAFILYLDFITSNEMIVADFNKFSRVRLKTDKLNENESMTEVDSLAKTLRTSKNVTGSATIFTEEQMLGKNAPRELIDFVNEIAAE